ncbi:MAG TPA: class I SAM-dependent methyltransferase [Anaerolineales bacterium]|nr:class I SAM-dependent methyltransferase [Anaerolineales bacterium]
MSILRDKLYRTYDKHNNRVNVSSPVSRFPKRVQRRLDRMFGEMMSGLPAGARVLDLGCGSGRLVHWLSRFDVHATGVDLSEPQIAVARENVPGAKFLLQDGLRYLGENKSCYDAIFSFDVFEHVPGEDTLLAWIEAVYATLKDGGFFICRVPNAANLTAAFVRYADLTHERLFTTNSLKQLFEAGGFVESRIIPQADAHFTGKVRLALMRLFHRCVFSICGRGYERNFDGNISVIGYKRSG